MNKICTSLKQSKKLIELGIDISTADMYYKYVLPKSDKIHHIPKIGNPVNSLKWYNEGYTFRGKKEPITLNEYCIPCWSLSALLELMPTFTLNGYGNGQFNCRDERANNYALVDTCPLDAAFEMICWLKENKKL